MKKRLFLVNYKFTTAGYDYNEYKLVSIKYEGTMDEEWGMRLAEAEVAALFEGTEGALISVVASTALEKVYTQPKLGLVKAEVPVGWFTNDAKPLLDHDGYGEEADISDLVLIDIDGKRETFVTGKYHYPFKDQAGWWQVDKHFESSLQPDNMRWSYLPLAKYK